MPNALIAVTAPIMRMVYESLYKHERRNYDLVLYVALSLPFLSVPFLSILFILFFFFFEEEEGLGPWDNLPWIHACLPRTYLLCCLGFFCTYQVVNHGYLHLPEREILSLPIPPHSKNISEKDDICRYQELVCKLIWDVLVPRRVDAGMGL